MAYQTTYESNPPVAFVGQVADTQHATILSHIADGQVGFGVPVILSAEDTVRVVTTGDTTITGIAVRQEAIDPTVPNAVADGRGVSTLTEGPIWVTAGEAIAAGDPVYVTVADASFKKTDTGNVRLEGATYETAAASGALVRLRIK